jgi:peptide/nickel transport system substrate-binding protein
MAIDRHELSKVLNIPEGVPILDTITTERQFWKSMYPEPIAYDPQEARKLLESEGWRDTDNDGIRDREGKKFHFTLLTHTTSGQGVYIQSQFQKIGVKMEILTVNNAVTKSRIRTGEFEAIFRGFNNSISHPFGHIPILGENSYIGYANPEMNRLLELAVDTIDLGKRDEIYKKIMPIFAEDMPITLLTPSVSISIAHQRIKGLVNIIRAAPSRDMEHLWIEEEKR